MNWTAPASDGGSPITGFEDDVRTGTTVVRTVTGLNRNTTSTVITGLTNGTAYNFVVRAVNAVGTGPDSAASDPVTPATAPSAPTIGSVVGGNAQATVTWTAPANDGGSPVTGYRVTILRLSSAAANATVRNRTTSTLLGPTVRSRSFTLPGSNYRFQVVAVNANGVGAPSARSSNVVPR